MRRRAALAAAAGFASGVLAGLIVWSAQTQGARYDLFSDRRWRRLAALGHIRGRPGLSTVQQLRDYVAWEQHTGLRRRGTTILRRMEDSLE